jgi:hypothetical protein
LATAGEEALLGPLAKAEQGWMPRYFFHIHDGEESMDEDGTALSDDDAARSHAIVMAGQMLRDAGLKFWDGNEWRLWVTDESGDVVCSLKFTAECR